jgi:hypothetical protein
MNNKGVCLLKISSINKLLTVNGNEIFVGRSPILDRFPRASFQPDNAVSSSFSIIKPASCARRKILAACMTFEGRGLAPRFYRTGSKFEPQPLHIKLHDTLKTYMKTDLNSQWDPKPRKDISKCLMVRSYAVKMNNPSETDFDQVVSLRTKSQRLSQSPKKGLPPTKTSVAAMMMEMTTTMINQRPPPG